MIPLDPWSYGFYGLQILGITVRDSTSRTALQPLNMRRLDLVLFFEVMNQTCREIKNPGMKL
ncbi:hypothetical protein CLW00_11657 [Mongoliibacter ruber]|uniref:Uncharacterized protein n=1 Tax=Mongoliibacter ruber TaxID=1750599 RepID=A0A2T0WDW1_9BACT|nr:hypothetical protein CLW00_11657 [Mongoliibacter ruber]